MIYLLSHNRHTTWCCVTVTVDLLKVNCFARTECCLIEFYAELCTKIAIKHSKYDKILSNCAKNMKKCIFCQFCVPILKCCANYRNFCAEKHPRVRSFYKLCVTGSPSSRNRPVLRHVDVIFTLQGSISDKVTIMWRYVMRSSSSVLRRSKVSILRHQCWPRAKANTPTASNRHIFHFPAYFCVSSPNVVFLHPSCWYFPHVFLFAPWMETISKWGAWLLQQTGFRLPGLALIWWNAVI